MIRALTFDVVGTLIDFETGMLRCVRSVGEGPDDEEVLAAFAAEEDVQQQSTPEMPFTAMLDPISTRLARALAMPGLDGGDGASPLRRSIGSWPAFPDGVTVDDVRANKPDPQFFAYVLGRLSASGIAREEVLHVAQSRYHDIATAQRLGMATCWVDRRHGSAGTGATPAARTEVVPDRRVTGLAELL